MSETASKKQVSSWFKPGVGGNPAGRPKGAVSKYHKSIKDMVLMALRDVGGAEYFARQAEENPVAFMGLVGKVLPLQLAGHDGGRLQVDFRWADDAKVTNETTATATIDAIVADATTDQQLTIVWEDESD